MTLRWSFLGVLLANLAACTSSAGDDAASYEQEDKVKPGDSEALGRLVVHGPPGPVTLGYSLRVDGARIAPDAETRLTAGRHLLAIVHDGADWGTSPRSATQVRRVEIQKDTTTTVDLSSLLVQFTPPDLAEGDVNVVSKPSIELTTFNTLPNDCGARAWTCTQNVYACQPSGNGSTCWTWYVSGRSARGTYATQSACASACGANSIYGPLSPVCDQGKDDFCDQGETQRLVATDDLRGAWSGSNGAPLAVFAGSYAVTAPAGKASATLGASAYQIVSLGAARVSRASIAVRAPVRETPDARTDKLVVKLTGQGRNEAQVDVARERTVKAVGFAPGERNASLTLGARTMPITLQDGATMPLPLGRIDVDDVTVRRENGTSYEQKGTYVVTCLTDGVVIGTFPTATGIDVLPGDYRADVSYTTAEGPKTQSYRFHF